MFAPEPRREKAEQERPEQRNTEFSLENRLVATQLVLMNAPDLAHPPPRTSDLLRNVSISRCLERRKLSSQSQSRSPSSG